MNKRLVKGYVLIILVWLLYIMLTVPLPKTVIFWIAAGFSVPVLFAQMITLHTIDRPDTLMKNRALDYPKLRVSLIYTGVQFAAGLLLMKFAARIPIWAATAIETAILLLAVTAFYAVEAACAEVIRQKERMQDAIAGMRNFQETINRLLVHCDQEPMQTRLRKLADEMRYCSPTSTDGSLEIEKETASLLTELEDCVLANDADTVLILCDQITELLRERDRICKDKR